MAIIKDFNTQFGIIAPYHRISKIEILDHFIKFTVDIYASLEARQARSSPLSTQIVEFPISYLNVDPRDLFYPLLQQYEYSYLKDGVSHISDGVTPHPTLFTATVIRPVMPGDPPPHN